MCETCAKPVQNLLEAGGGSGKKLYRIRYRNYTQTSSREGKKEAGTPPPPARLREIGENSIKSGSVEARTDHRGVMVLVLFLCISGGFVHILSWT